MAQHWQHKKCRGTSLIELFEKYKDKFYETILPLKILKTLIQKAFKDNKNTISSTIILE